MTARFGTVLMAGALVLGGACAPAAAPPKATLTAASIVPLQSVENLVLASVKINRSDQAAVFTVDTGASKTIMSPLLARRLGLTVPRDAVRHDLRIVGGTVVTVPFIRVSSLQVGEAMIEEMEVGIYDFAPDTRVIDGMLGGDFLNRFRVTFDQAARRMTLEPLPAAR